MEVEDTISTLQRLREENGNDWKTAVEKGREEERNEESLAICDYFMHPSIERERGLLDEKRVKRIARRMDMITEEMKESNMEASEYRVNKQAVEKKPAAKSESPWVIERMLSLEQYLMELLLLYEVKEWELFFWNKLKAFLDQIDWKRKNIDERVESQLLEETQSPDAQS